MTDIVFLVLLFVHIVTIVLWMGASVLFVSVIAPSLTKLTPSSRTDFFKSVAPRYTRYASGVATVSIVAGLILYAYITQISSSLAPTSSGMPWVLAGILFGLAAYIIGMAVVLRSNSRLLRLMSQPSTGQTGTGASPEEMQSLQRRIAMSSRIQALLLALALVSMVVGANL